MANRRHVKGIEEDVFLGRNAIGSIDAAHFVGSGVAGCNSLLDRRKFEKILDSDHLIP